MSQTRLFSERLVPVVLASTLLLAGALPAIQPPSAVTARATQGGGLAVRAVSPAHGTPEVATDAPLAVQFNQPVAPLTTLEAQADRPVLHITPPVEGVGRWVNSSLYTFTPRPGWLPSATYQVAVLPDVTSPLAGPLSAPFEWSFTTVSPRVLEVVPAAGSQFADPAGPVTIRFNQPMDRGSVEARFRLTDDAGVAIPGQPLWDDEGARFRFQPDAPLEAGRIYVVTLEAGATGAGGAATAPAQRWQFRVAPEPRVVLTSPSEGTTPAEFSAVQITFSAPMDRRSVTLGLAIDPRPTDDPFLNWEANDTQVTFWPGLKPNQQVTVTITGAVDRFGRPMPDFTLHFQTPSPPPGMFVVRRGALNTLDAAAQPYLLLRSWGFREVPFALYRVGRTDALRLAADSEALRQYVPNPDGLVRMWRVRPQAEDIDQAVLTRVDLLEDPAARLAPGYYYVQVGAEGSERLLLAAGRTHLTLKRSATEAFVWATDLGSGQPVAGLPLLALDEKGAVLAQGSTDAEGIARLGLPDKYPSFASIQVVADRDDDAAVVDSAWSDGIHAFDFQVPWDWSPRTVVGTIYTDRPIYRPGQTVYFKVIARADTGIGYELLPPDAEVSLTVLDPNGVTVLTRSGPFGDFGTLTGEVPLGEDAALGNYTLTLQVAGEYAAGGSFLVAAYRKPDFEVLLQPEQREYYHGDIIGAAVDARYYFGAPAAGSAVRWQVTRRDYFFSWAAEPDFQFGEYTWRRRPTGGLVTDGRGTLDDQGHFEINFPADLSQQDASQIYTLDVTITDPDNRSVSTSADVIVHKGSYYIGARAERWVVPAGGTANLDLVALDPHRQGVADAPLRAEIYERQWRSVREQDDESEFVWRSQAEDTLVETRDLHTGPDGRAALQFTAARVGTYHVVLRSLDSAAAAPPTAIDLWVYGDAYASWQIGNHNRIGLLLDRSEYQVGDVARLLIASPFERGLALLTIERASVVSHQIVPITGNSATVELPVEAAYQPNMYVAVTLVRPREGEVPAALRFGLVELKVSTADRVLSLHLTPSTEQAQPGDRVRFDIEVRDAAGQPAAAELSLALVDAAVLALVDERMDTLAQAFWNRRGLAVTTGASYTTSIERLNELALNQAKGGGGTEAPSVRERFPDTAFWEGALRTDADGRAQVEVTLPDSLTTWRMTARAITVDTRVGEARAELVTSKPLLVRPALPRFLTAGDRAELVATVHNSSTETLEVSVAAATEGLALEGEADQRVEVPAGGSALLTWLAHAEQAGTASVTLSAEAGVLHDAVRVALPIVSRGSAEVVASSGLVRDRVIEEITLPADVDRQRGELTLTLEPSLAAGMQAGEDFLRAWEYEAPAHTASRLLGELALARAGTAANGDSGDRRERIQSAIARLLNNRTPEGGWGWWSDSPPDPAITGYVLFSLGEARSLGFSIAEEALQPGVGYAIEQLTRQRDERTPLAPEARADLLLGLAAVGSGDLGLTGALAEQGSELGPAVQAELALALQRISAPDDPRLATLLGRLTAAAVVSGSGAHWEESAPDRGWNSTTVRSTSLALLALARLAPDHPLRDLATRWLMATRTDGHWASPRDTALTLFALSEALRASGGPPPDFAYRASLDGRELLAGQVSGAEGYRPLTASVPLVQLATEGSRALAITRTPPAEEGPPLYYRTHLRYFPAIPEASARSEGISVGRTYSLAADETEQPISGAAAGDLVRVVVTVVAEHDLRDVVVEDFLPAGLEPIDVTLKTTSRAERVQFFAERRELAKAEREPWRFDRFVIGDQKVSLFAEHLPRGTYQYSYLARAVLRGDFAVRAIRAFETYFPEVWGRGDEARFTVN